MQQINRSLDIHQSSGRVTRQMRVLAAAAVIGLTGGLAKHEPTSAPAAPVSALPNVTSESSFSDLSGQTGPMTPLPSMTSTPGLR